MADYLRKLRQESEIRNGAAFAVDDKRGKGFDYTYLNPTKEERSIRRKIMDRYRRMRDSTLRKEAEEDWEQGAKFYRLWRPKRDVDDWRADIRLPDAFASIQTHMQETINMKMRPALSTSTGKKAVYEFYANSILNFNMDRTGYDLETYKAFLGAASHGTAFTMEFYLREEREVEDLDSIRDGVITYKKRTIVDKDDTFTKKIDNEYIFIDEAADVIDVAEDMVYREVMRYDTFVARFSDDAIWKNTDYVIPCGSLSERTHFFDRGDDMEGDHVELLHYYNKITDTYAVLANTVIIRQGPIPFKHKELPVAVWNYYPVEGSIYGMGIPRIMAPTQEEREAIRNISIDRQKMHLSKMFLVNDLFEIDEDEATTRPHGFIHVNANGMPLSNVIQPIEYGDVPGSSIRMDDQLRDDEKRVTGIDDRSQGVNMGGTATEAAILTEQSQKRIGMIATLTGMQTIERVGKLKYSNINFFYSGPRVEEIKNEKGEDELKLHYRTITVKGKEFKLTKDSGTGKVELDMKNISGASTFELDPDHAGLLEDDPYVYMTFDTKGMMPKAIRQQRKMEFFQGLIANPMVMGEINLRNALTDVIYEQDFDPKIWLNEEGMDDNDQIQLASYENMVMAAGQDLAPTAGASEIHTMVHMWYTQSKEYEERVKANPGIGLIFQRHILGENENGPGAGALGGTENPAAGAAAVTGAEPVDPLAGIEAPDAETQAALQAVMAGPGGTNPVPSEGGPQPPEQTAPNPVMQNGGA